MKNNKNTILKKFKMRSSLGKCKSRYKYKKSYFKFLKSTTNTCQTLFPEFISNTNCIKNI